jgi:hypothetical protein
MSVSLEASMYKPITLAAVIDQTRDILSGLLGLATMPELVVVADRQYDDGVRTDPGHRLDAAELGGTVIGDPIPPDELGLSGSVHYEIDVPATGDGVGLTVMDFHHEEFAELRGYRHAMLDPYRTSVSKTVATGVALAVAQLADGEIVDDQIGRFIPRVSDPGQIIDLTRLPEPGTDFTTQCETYMRQFPRHTSRP